MSEMFPRKHAGPFQKVKAHTEQRTRKGITARLRAARSRKVKAAEAREMGKARERDGYCRFILCPCRMHGAVPQVSHVKHRGMGGNPALDRTTPALLLLLCQWRHKDSRYSLDRGTIRWIPVSESKGANGPIMWQIDSGAFPNDDAHFWIRTMAREDGWIVLGVEIEPHRYYPIEQVAPATWRLIQWLTAEWVEQAPI